MHRFCTELCTLNSQKRCFNGIFSQNWVFFTFFSFPDYSILSESFETHMKILISGTFCSGKSTLAIELKKKIRNSILITEPIRELSKVFSHDGLLHEEVRDYLLVRQIFEEKLAHANNGFIICDAGIESNIAHNRLFNQGNKSAVNLERFDLRRYDLVFFCDYLEIPIIDDGFRMTDTQMRAKLSETLMDILLELNYAPIPIRGNLDTRIEKVMKEIKKYKSKVMNKKEVSLSGCLVKNDRNEYLLIHRNHGKFKQWEVPGGKAEDNETTSEAAAREIKEELNITIEVNKLLHVNRFAEDGTNYVYHIYAGKVLAGEIDIVKKNKFDRFSFFSIADLERDKSQLSENMKLFVDSLKGNKI